MYEIILATFLSLVIFFGMFAAASVYTHALFAKEIAKENSSEKQQPTFITGVGKINYDLQSKQKQSDENKS